MLACLGARVTLSDRLLYRWSAICRRQALAAGLVVNDQVLGIAWTGHMTADRIGRALPRLPFGLTELYLHPASHRDALLTRLMPDYEHEAEAACLADPAIRDAIRRFDIRLTTWTAASDGF